MLNSAELTILSLVAEGARYGYEIEQVIDQRGLRDWLVVGSASIYYILRKLDRQGLLVCQGAPGKPADEHSVYQLSEAGRGVLQTALSDLLRQPHTLGAGFELALANLGVLQPAQVYRALQQRHAELSRRIEQTDAVWQQHRQDAHLPDYKRALFTHNLAIMRAEQTWLDAFLADWRTRYPAVTEHAPDDETVHTKKTLLHHRTQPKAAKLAQTLKRRSSTSEE